jgi:hypothetical protein
MVPRAGNRHRLCEFGIAALVAESPSDPADAKGEYGVEFVPLGHFTKLHELILAVPRRILAEGGWDNCLPRSRRRGVCRCQVGGSA